MNEGSAIRIPPPTLMWECPWARHEPERQRVRVCVLVKHMGHREGAAKLYSSAVHFPFNIHFLLHFIYISNRALEANNNSLGPHLEAADSNMRFWTVERHELQMFQMC